ncbi:hypothetical protein FUA23_08455 [Neolewinella aurantiaca]|uniref:Outer membrane protein beta-barrel domain-containing protein n=1 Tax=Neolewinella aurantiaca TaxID=2602767 RepID=A0A5C7FJE1_9BACT|nr:hypothetical protein [Neolewinella aurantiaca]TXF89975.1 hypothetical protein FUA23_08455 [Neolewinella aurantiaca]
MKHLLALSFLLPFYLSGQCYGSFEVFGAHGRSNEPNTFLRELGLEENYSPVNVNRFGFGASFRLGRQTYARVAMQFSQYGFGWSSNDLRWGTQHDGDGGFDPNLDPDLSSSVKVENRDYYGEGVLALGYQLRTRSSWKPFAEIGGGIGKYIASGSRTEYNFIPNDGGEGLQIEAVDWYRSVGYVGRAGLGTNYVFNDHFAVYGMAVFQQHLRTINRTGSAKIHPWQATLELGVRVFVDPR